MLDSGDHFGVTFTTDNLFHPAAEEPKAAPTAERLATLERAKYNGVNTWVSCEPVLYPNAVFNLIQNGWYIDLFKIGKLNHAAPPAEIVKAGGWAAFGKEAERLCRAYGRAYYIKEDLRAEMKKARGT